MARTTSSTGFQPRNTPAERRAFFHQHRLVARLQRRLDELEAAGAAGIGDMLTEDPAGSSLYLSSTAITEDPAGTGFYTSVETMIEDPLGSSLYRLE